MTKHFIYELWLGDELVYVGASPNPKARHNAHRSGFRFMSETELRIVAEYRRRATALKAEAERIREMAPPFNVVWHPSCDMTPASRAKRKAEVKADKMQREREYWKRITAERQREWDEINRLVIEEQARANAGR